MKRIFIIFVSLLLASSLKAQKLDVIFDYSVFKYNSDSSLVEIYYSLLDSTLVYQPSSDNHLTARLQFQAQFTHQQKQTIQTLKWDFKQTKSNKDSNLIYSLFGVQRVILPRGDYKAVIECWDGNNPSNKYTLSEDLKVFIFNNEKPVLSTIEMAGIIENTFEKSRNWNEMFQKGNKFVLPNPTLEYTSENPNLQFYFETYNTSRTKGKLFYQISILDGAKRDVFKTLIPVGTNVQTTPNSENDDYGRTLSVPLDLLPTGVYYLRISLINQTDLTEKLDEVYKKFYYYNQYIAPQLTSNFTEDQLFEMSEFATMNLDKVELEFKKASFIAKSIEIDQWKKLTELQGKQRFLYRFWALRDDDTTTILNERKMKFDEAVDYANTYFVYGKHLDGWNTDRGRILLKYGEPTQIDRTPSNGTDRPYEDWFYAEIQGGVHFYFVDVMGFNNYILVNSNALGEIQNKNWYNDYVKVANDIFENQKR